jgi:hypothetical protein
LATGDGGEGEEGESARRRESLSVNFSFQASIIARHFETQTLDLQCERRNNHESKSGKGNSFFLVFYYLGMHGGDREDMNEERYELVRCNGNGREILSSPVSSNRGTTKQFSRREQSGFDVHPTRY